MGNGHSGPLDDFEPVNRGGKGRLSSRSLPEESSGRRMRGKENERGLIKAMGSRRSKKIRTEKKEAAAESLQRRDAAPYYAPAGFYRRGPRSLDAPMASASADDHWSDIASDVGFRTRHQKSRAPTVPSLPHPPHSATPTSQLYFYQQTRPSSLSRRDKERKDENLMPPPPRPPRSAQSHKSQQPTVSAASVMSNETWLDRAPSSTPTPQSLRRELMGESSSPGKAARESPWGGASRSPECDKLIIASLRSELEEERRQRVALEKRLANLEQSEIRHLDKLNKQIERQQRSYKRRLAEKDAEYRRIYGDQLEEIAQELAATIAKQSQYREEIHDLRMEKRDLASEVSRLEEELRSVQEARVANEWHFRKQLALVSSQGLPSPGAMHSFASATRTSTRAHTLDKTYATPGHRSSMGSDPSLPSGRSATGSSPTSAGEGLISQPPSFLDEHHFHFTSSPLRMPPPPPPSKSTLNPIVPSLPPRQPLQTLQNNEEGDDEVKDFSLAHKHKESPHDNSEISDVEGFRGAEESSVSIRHRRMLSSILGSERAESVLLSTPKASPSASDADETPREEDFIENRHLDDGYDTMTTHTERKDATGQPISNSSSGICSEAQAFIPLAKLNSLDSIPSLPSSPAVPPLVRSHSTPPTLRPPVLSLRCGQLRSLLNAVSEHKRPEEAVPSISLDDLVDYGHEVIRRQLLSSEATDFEPRDEEGSPDALANAHPNTASSIQRLEASLDLDKSFNDSFLALVGGSSEVSVHPPSTSSPIRLLKLRSSPLGPKASASARRGKAIVEAEMGRRLRSTSFTTSSDSEEEEEGASTQAAWERQLRTSECGRCRYQPPSWKRSILSRRVFNRFGREEKSALAKFDFLEGEESSAHLSPSDSTTSDSSPDADSGAVRKRAKERTSSTDNSSLLLSDLAARDQSLSSDSSLSFHCL